MIVDLFRNNTENPMRISSAILSKACYKCCS